MKASSTFELTCDLIRRPSVTPADAGCLELIGERLAPLGFKLEPLPFGEVSNLWATLGSDTPVFCFAGHTDVVPPGDISHWTSSPYEPVVRGDHLYGRGAADMKGSLAAMVTAVEKFVHAAQKEFRGTLAFLLTSDEEGVAVDGTRRVVETLRQRGQAITWCLVGEPSSRDTLGDLLRNGRRGSLNARMWVAGIQGHVAYPELARNPIHQFAPALNELCATRWDNGNEFFPPTSFQISNYRAGTGVENVIPPQCEVWFNFRFSTASTVESLKSRVHEICDRHKLDYRIDWSLSGAPFQTGRGALLDAVVDTVRAQRGIKPELSTGGGTSDGRFIATLGTEVVELGPVNATIHKIDECVRVSELEQLSDIYCGILQRLLV